MSDTLYGFRANKSKAEIPEIPEDKFLKRTLLWSNSSPTSSFGMQTITLSQKASDFDLVEFDLMENVSDNTIDVVRPVQLKIPSTIPATQPIALTVFSAIVSMYRNVYMKNSTKDILIGPAEYRNFNGGTGSDNKLLVPQNIYGIEYPS